MERNTHSMSEAVIARLKALFGVTREDDDDTRPAGCECLTHADLPCFECHMAGFETPAGQDD